MIAANELRIGNWIQVNDNGNLLYFKVHGVYEAVVFANDSNSALPPGSYLPIPITPEILEKCGFEYSADKWQLEVRGVMYIIEKQADWFFAGIKSNKSIVYFSWYIHSLHQLQNLYFALTGEELEVSL